MIRYVVHATSVGACIGATVGLAIGVIHRKSPIVPPTTISAQATTLSAELDDAIDEIRLLFPSSQHTHSIKSMVDTLAELERLASKSVPRARDEKSARVNRTRSTSAHVIARRARDTLLELGTVLEAQSESTQAAFQTQAGIIDDAISDILYNINISSTAD